MARRTKPVVVNLDDEFQIHMVNDRFQEFLHVMEEERPVEVDMSRVNSVDFAGLQLLYSLKRSCEEKDLDFRLSHVTPPVEQKIALCGLDRELLKDGADGSV
ncbi:MAG: STAS domain-containing protein [Spirochaetales bacterium]|nr:STAS domain-containing protein [Spirochaetales bacterium]